MKFIIKNPIKDIAVILLAFSLPMLTGCEKYLENTDLPSGTIAGEDAFVSDNAVAAIVTGNFLLITDKGPFASYTGNTAFLTGLYTDELQPLPNTTGNMPVQLFYADAITSNRVGQWQNFYSIIYSVNAAIEGIQSTKATLYHKDQWLGESYFQRALMYFNLVNLFGDVPLALTTDYTLNNALSRAPQSEVYRQIIKDLQVAQGLLGSTDYKDGYGSATAHRVRPNKAAATALLAKVHLYAKEWSNAEALATAVIDNAAYELLPPAQVFLLNSRETIWAIALKNEGKTFEYDMYNKGMPATTATEPNQYVQVSMSGNLRNVFEAGDARYANWVRSTEHTGVSPSVTYYFPNKYQSASNGGERSIILRLAEMYLVRAEARAQQNNITGVNSAASDVDAIRSRAGLTGTTATTQEDMLAAIAQERQVELFTECGNRFFDLKRTEKIDAVMNVVAAQKGTTWSSYKQLWPIPEREITLNPNITPNPGY